MNPSIREDTTTTMTTSDDLTQIESTSITTVTEAVPAESLDSPSEIPASGVTGVHIVHASKTVDIDSFNAGEIAEQASSVLNTVLTGEPDEADSDSSDEEDIESLLMRMGMQPRGELKKPQSTAVRSNTLNRMDSKLQREKEKKATLNNTSASKSDTAKSVKKK